MAKKTIADSVTEFKSFGTCQINIDLAVKYFDDDSFILYELKDNEEKIYSLYRETKGIITKFHITEKDALELIERLNLMFFPYMTKYFAHYYPLHSKHALLEKFALIPTAERTFTLNEFIIQEREKRDLELKKAKQN